MTTGRFREGQRVMRYLSSARVPMAMVVTRIHDGLVWCGPWSFDDVTGAEIDHELGWDTRQTGSVIEEIPSEEWERQRAAQSQRMRTLGLPDPEEVP